MLWCSRLLCCLQVCEQRLKAAAGSLQALLPVLKALQNVHLKPSHWQRLLEQTDLARFESDHTELRLLDLVSVQV